MGMITGHNSNVRHGERVFHVQTEDSGRARPHVTTLLYFEGTILASERAEYAAMLDAEDLEARVRRLMDEQHASVVERLRRGDFDAAIEARLSGASRQPAPPSELATPPASPVPRTLRAPAAGKPGAAAPAKGAPAAASERPRPFGDGIVSERPLDAVILDYLVARSRERSGGGRGPRSGG
jgi:hypothetical protein